jgi:hypothetical protein
MKIIENCWEKIDTYNCQYGAHIFSDSIAKIYINQWLATWMNPAENFSRKNDEGFVGHCLLVFKGVKTFDFSVKTHHKDEAGKIIWHEPVIFHYEGDAQDGLTKYEFEGSLHGFPSSVDIRIEAQKFELHILEKDEPAKDS